MVSMKTWTAVLEPRGVADTTLRALVIFGISAWLFFNGMVFQVPYSDTLMELHLYPWWNILLALMVAAGAYWCPRVGALAALAVLLYLSDMHLLMSPIDSEFEEAIKEHLADMVDAGGADATE
jgi:hypothetical protein